jgi:hypothetical protein
VTVARRGEGLTGRDLASINDVSPLAAALRYAELGLPVFPVAPVDRSTGTCGCKDGEACESVGKHPLVRWADKATIDPGQIASWWGSWKPDANIGVPTGQRSGLVVVDIDRQHDGHATRKTLEAAGQVFPATLAARTRNGGWHFVYAAPEGVRVPNTTAALAGVGDTPGIDVRGDGGYIIVAPSVRPVDPDPQTGALRFGRYAWAAQDHPVAPAPSWVVTPKPQPRPQPAPPATRAVVAGPAGRDPHKRAAAALAAEVARVAVARSEQRNKTLFQAAANLFEIVNTGYLDEVQVRAELTAAGMAVGLGEREIAQTLDAQWRRKQGVRRAGWEAGGGGAGSDHLRLRRAQMMVGPPVWGGSRGGGFGR